MSGQEECAHRYRWKLSDGRYRCRRCKARFREQAAWDASRLPNSVKRKLVEYWVLGVPAYRLRFKKLASPKAIERFYRIIRSICARHEGLREPFSGAVECDETAFGGHREGKRGWGAAGKVIVLGILKRNGQVKVFPIQGRKHKPVIDLVAKNTTPGSLYYTDEWQAYISLKLRGDHVVVKKEKGKPKGRDHINGIEGFWSYAKHWLYPYRGVPRKYFHLYLGEVAFRFNNREHDLVPIITKLLKSLPRMD